MLPSENEQTMSQIRDNIPRMWWNIYQGSLQAGFPAPIALDLLKTFILGSSGVKMVPPNSVNEPGSDTPPE